MRRAGRIALAVAACATLFAGATRARDAANKAMGARPLPDEVLFTPGSAVLKPASLGFTELVADYYWLKAIQFFGDKENMTPEKIRHLFTLTDLVTDLAPDFEYAYRFGAVTVTFFETNGDLAVKLLLKGLARAPNDWQVPYLLGYMYYFLLLKPATAATYYELAGTVALRNGVSEMGWLHNLARKLMVDAENPDLMLPVLEKMYRDEPDPTLRERHLKRLVEGLRKRNVVYLQREVERFNRDTGRYPNDLNELTAEDYVNLVPPDMEGGGYVLEGNTVVWRR